jgi:NAD+ synthase (glutamine-hydrolysing)
MKITIGQINTTNGDIDGNVAKILGAIEAAKREGSDMIVFPKSYACYTSQDWFLDKDIIECVAEPLKKIVDATKDIIAIVGTIRRNDETDGRRLFNSAAVFHDGKLLGFADKTLLPEYDVFDDPRYFEPADVRKMFEIDGRKIGVVVCEDFGTIKPFGRKDYTTLTRLMN